MTNRSFWGSIDDTRNYIKRRDGPCSWCIHTICIHIYIHISYTFLYYIYHKFSIPVYISIFMWYVIRILLLWIYKKKQSIKKSSSKQYCGPIPRFRGGSKCGPSMACRIDSGQPRLVLGLLTAMWLVRFFFLVLFLQHLLSASKQHCETPYLNECKGDPNNIISTSDHILHLQYMNSIWIPMKLPTFYTSHPLPWRSRLWAPRLPPNQLRVQDGQHARAPVPKGKQYGIKLY